MTNTKTKRILTMVLAVLMAIKMLLISPLAGLTAYAAEGELTIKASMLGGAELTDGKYVWNADSSAKGHEFRFRINFESSGQHDQPVGAFKITIPKSILRDSAGAPADEYEISVPKAGNDVSTGGGGSTNFVYTEEGDNLVITNARVISAATNSFVDISYRTSKTTFEYNDMEASAPFQATFATTEESVQSEAIPVYINTGSKIDSTAKKQPSIYYSWDNTWGTDAKPENDTDYNYLVWEIESNISNPTKKYTFSLEDTILKPESGAEVVGFKMSGQKTYSTTGSVADQTGSGKRFDYVITKHPKTDFEAGTYTVQNKITSSVTTGEDETTSAVSTRSYTWNRPVFAGNGATATLGKYGNDNWGQRYAQAWDYASYDLEGLATGRTESISGLKYNLHFNALPYQWTAGQSESEKDAQKYWEKPVTYRITDKVAYLFRDKDDKFVDAEDVGSVVVPENNILTPDDYDVTSIEYSVLISEAGELDPNTQTFPKKEHTYNESDIITFYAVVDGETKKAGSYNLGNDESVDVDESIVYSIGKNSVEFKPGVDGFYAEVTNAYYNTTIDLNPTLTLFSTAHVQSICQDQSLVIVKNRSNMEVFLEGSDGELGEQVMEQTSVAGDRIRKIQRSSSLKKSLETTGNDTATQNYRMTWSVKEAEQAINAEGQKEYIKQNGGRFYDLLPQGATLDQSSVSVITEKGTLDPGDYSITLESDYNESGRIMMIIEVKPQAEYYQLKYDTLISWDALKDFGYNQESGGTGGSSVSNPVAYETGNDSIYGGYPDNGGKLSSANRDLFVDLDEDTDDEKFLYAEDSRFISVLTSGIAGLDKKVMSEEDSDWKYDTIVEQDGTYQYRLRYANTDSSAVKNIVFYDVLENFTNGEDTSQWYGTLKSIDVSQLRQKGADPTVYVSESRSLDDATKTTGDAPEYKSWTTLSDYRTTHDDLSAIKAIVVDVGEDYEIKPSDTAVVVLTMTAPSQVPLTNTVYPENYNDIYFFGTVVDRAGGSKFKLHQYYTTVKYHATGAFTVHKVSETDGTTVIPGVSFRVTGTSKYGTNVDQIIKTNSEGNATFTHLEEGTYRLQESAGVPDYLEDHTEHIVTVDQNGIVEVDGEGFSTSRPYLLATNKPRVHNDVVFYKYDTTSKEATTKTAVEGAVFKLSGTSDYGNAISTYVTSPKTGKVNFENIEKGTYTLVETTAPAGYIPDDTKYTVIVDENANATITGDSVQKERNGRYTIYNEPYHSFKILKMSALDGTALEGAVYNISGTSDRGTEINLDVTTDKSGIGKFENLESGSYILQETTAPEGYKIDETKRSVVITAEGSVTISGVSQDKQGNFLLTDQKIPTGEVVVTKKWVDNVDNTISADKLPTIHAQVTDPATEEPTESAPRRAIRPVLRAATALNEAPIGAKSLDHGQTGDVIWNIYDNGELVFTPKDATKRSNLSGSGRGWQRSDWKELVKKVRFEGDIYMTGGNAEQTFSGLSNVEVIDLANLDLKEVTSLKAFFATRSGTTGVQALPKLTTILNLDKMDVSNVTDMRGMFAGCSSLTELDLSNFKTDQVLYMQDMMKDCTSLEKLDISSFNTAKANVANMFSGDTALKEITLGTSLAAKSNYGLPTHAAQTIDGTAYAEDLWSKDYARNTVEQKSSADLLSTYTADMAGTWYWQEAIDPATAAAQKYTTTSNIYDLTKSPEERAADLAAFQTPDEDGNAGFWTQIDDSTWTYTFYVYDSNHPWYIWEDEVSGYVGDHDSIAKDLKIENGSEEAVITNTDEDIANRTFGSLKVEKSVTGTSDTETEFDFTVTLKNDSAKDAIEGVKTFGSTTFSNGVAHIKLKAGESATFTKIPTGTTYTVVEASAENYTTESSGSQGSIKEDETATASFTNTYHEPPKPEEPKYVSFTITKQVTGNEALADGMQFGFEVKFSNLEPNTDYALGDGRKVHSNAEGKAEIADLKLAKGGSATFSGLPVGAKYQILEASGDYISSYQVTDANNMGMITKASDANKVKAQAIATAEETADEGEDITVTFSNEMIQTKKITLTNTVLDETGAEDTADASKYAFNVRFRKLPAGYVLNTSRGALTADQNGDINITYLMTGGEDVVFENVPMGAEYKITEEASTMIVSYDGTDDSQPATQTPFDSGTNEGDTDQDVSTGNNDEFTSVDDKPDAVTLAFTNQPLGKGELTISKQVTGNLASASKEFELIVTLTNAKQPVNGTFQARSSSPGAAGDAATATTVEFSNAGQAVVRLRANEAITIEDIPAGYEYMVGEADYSKDGYTIASVNGIEGAKDTSGTIEPDTEEIKQSADFVNHAETMVPTAAHVGMGPFGIIAALVALGGALVRRRKQRRQEQQ